MTNNPIQLPWEQPGWLEQATAWIQAKVTEYGWQTTSPVELIHQRPWSTFAQVTTEQGLVYFKAPAPMLIFEAALTQALAKWRPDCMVPLLAIDLDQGWILSADTGTTLRQLTRAVDQIDHWLKVLPLYSEFQIDLVERVPDLLALGTPDRRLTQMPQLYSQLLTATDSLRLGQEPGLTPAEYQQLQKGQPRFAEACQQLAAYGLPETITHEEIHENNVVYGTRGYIFTDWSDSSVSHPFFSMLVTLRSIAHWLKLDEAGPELQRVRDAYLEPWTKFATRAQLAAALELAYRLGMVNRALSWHEAISRLSQEQQEPYADSVYGWLQDYLQADGA